MSGGSSWEEFSKQFQKYRSISLRKVLLFIFEDLKKNFKLDEIFLFIGIDEHKKLNENEEDDSNSTLARKIMCEIMDIILSDFNKFKTVLRISFTSFLPSDFKEETISGRPLSRSFLTPLSIEDSKLLFKDFYHVREANKLAISMLTNHNRGLEILYQVFTELEDSQAKTISNIVDTEEIDYFRKILEKHSGYFRYYAAEANWEIFEPALTGRKICLEEKTNYNKIPTFEKASSHGFYINSNLYLDYLTIPFVPRSTL